LQLGSIKG